MSATIRGTYNYVAGSGIGVSVVLNTSTGQFDVTITNTGTLPTPVPVADGGTGQVSGTAHTVALWEGTAAMGATNVGSFGAPLLSDGGSGDPAFGRLDLTSNNAVQGAAANEVLAGTSFNTVGAIANGTAGWVLTSNGAGVTPTFQALPTAPTVAGGTGISVTGGPAYTVALSASGVAAGTYGDSTHYPTFVVDATGRVTSASQSTFPAAQTNSQFTSHIGGSTISLGASVTTLDSLTVTVATGQVVIVWASLHIFNNAADACTGDVTVDSAAFSALGQSIASLNTSGAVSHPLIRRFAGLSAGTHTIRLLAENGTHTGTSSVEWTMLAQVVSG